VPDNQNNPLVSIIIPIYNEEKYINKCIDSVIKQSFTNFEIIAIDDGSTDGTLEALRVFDDKRLKILSQEHSGRVAARNRGLRHAKGKYIMLQDADDWSENNRVELMVDKIKGMGEKAVVGSSYTVYNEKNDKSKFKKLKQYNSDIRKKMERSYCSQAVFPASIIAVKKQIIAIGGWRDKFDIAAEDGDLVERLFEDGSNFYNFQKPLYNYRLNNGSITNKLAITIPYQIFKRHCKKMRRNNKKEYESALKFSEYMNSNIFFRFKYRLMFLLFSLYHKTWM